ncbi:hypothetical protein BJX76DRAFT_174570 [Aspergillus varians]
MSRTRPPNLRRWSRLHNPSTLLFTPAARPSLLPIDNHPGKPNNHKISHPRLFHTTPSHNAAHPAPSTRRRAAQVNSTHRPAFPAQHLLKDLPDNPPPQSDALNAHLQALEKTAFRLASEMLHDEIIDQSITPKKVKRIGAALLKEAYGRNRSADAITRIAQAHGVDVDTIFEIGRAITRGHLELSKWVFSSCKLAGARMAIFLSAAKQLRMCHDSANVNDAKSLQVPQFSPSLAQIEALATRSEGEKEGQDNRDPRAMLIYAKYLGLRGKYAQGVNLVNDVLRMIEPSRLQPKPNEDLTISSMIEPPWELFLWLKRELRKKTKNDRGEDQGLTEDQRHAMQLGAVEYQDPKTLMRYAQQMGHERGIEFYETYMGQAAAAGNTSASRNLANFYYLVSLGVYPQSGTEAAKSTKLGRDRTATHTPNTLDLKPAKGWKGLLATLVSYFGPRPVAEYRSLALEWYNISWAQGSVGAGVDLALLYHEDGDIKKAETILKEVQRRADNPKTQHMVQVLLGSLSSPNLRSLVL